MRFAPLVRDRPCSNLAILLYRRRMAEDTNEGMLWGPAALQARRETIRALQARLAPNRKAWVEKNRYYYESISRLFRFLIEPGKRVLSIRSDLGQFLTAVNPQRGVGVELTPELAAEAAKLNPQWDYRVADPEQFVADEKFDYIVVANIGDTVDVQRALQNLQAGCERGTRVLIYTYNHLWEPIVGLAAWLGFKPVQEEQSWLSEGDLKGLLNLAGFEWLKTYRVATFPKNIPVVSFLLNRVIGALPLFNRLSFISVLVARPRGFARAPAELSVSVVIPCKNERGNIQPAVERIPELGCHTEIIFCDDKSTDGTAEEIERMRALYPQRDIKLVAGPGICKARNVYTGFDAATCDVLMILDADLAVMPEELPYFLEVLATNRAEFVNGSRMVYPVPREAMKLANMIGNQFFSWAFTFLLGERVKDTLCGTKVIWRNDWQRIRPLIDTWGKEDRWGDYELLFGASKLNLRISDLPVHYQERVYGTTKMNKRFKNGLIMLAFCWAGFKKLKMRL